MTMVLVHGGGCTKECWELMLPYLDGDVLALDLPGRGERPGDLTKIGVADFVDAVVDDIESRDLHDVVLVGHSLAGLTIPQVAGRVRDRIRALVFVSCTVPRDGESSYDTLDPEIQALSDGAPRTRSPRSTPRSRRPSSTTTSTTWSCSSGRWRLRFPSHPPPSATPWCSPPCRPTYAACGCASRAM